MTEPAQIGFVKSSQIGNAVFEHCDPLDPHTKGKALIFGGVDATIYQHLWVDHAAAEDLQPITAGADLQLATGARAADIDLGRRLGKREVAGPEADRQVVHAEKRAAEFDQAAFEMSHMGRPVDY